MSDYLINNPVSFLKMKPKIYISFVLLIILLIIIYGLNQKISSTINFQGVVYKNNEYELVLFVPYNQVLRVINNNQIVIDKEELNYNIIGISDDLKMLNNQNYQEVVIKLNLNSKYKINNLFIETKIIISKDKIYKKIWNNIIERE